MEASRVLVIFAVLTVGLVTAEVIKVQKCFEPVGYKNICAINEVRLSPCPEAAQNKPCRLKLGEEASISFDFTPTFSATKVGSGAYKVGTVADIPYHEMDSDGCKYLTCPLEANKKSTFNYSLRLNATYPVARETAKLKLWNEADHHQQCCFKVLIESVK